MNKTSIQSLPSSTRDATRLALRLGIPVHEIELHHFPDGELRITVGPAAQTTIIYTSLDQPNEKLLAILFAADTLRRDGARRLILVAPYLCYMRQDAAFRSGEAISQKIIGQFLAGVVDKIITVDAHLHRTKDIRNIFPGIEAENLSAMRAIAEALESTGFDPQTIIVGPDEESRPWVSNLAERLGADHAIGQKARYDDHSVRIEFSERYLFSGRPALLVDDIISSGGTIIACAKALIAVGANPIDVVVTHALFPAEMTDLFLRAGIRSIRSTYSVPHPTNAIILDGILGEALRSEPADLSVSTSWV